MKLAIYGAGGHAKVVVELAKQLGYLTPLSSKGPLYRKPRLLRRGFSFEILRAHEKLRRENPDLKNALDPPATGSATPFA